MPWLSIDLREDPDDPRYTGDPADLIDLATTLEELTQRPAWHAQAACRGAGPEPWFPARGHLLDAARAVCAGCPVQSDCLSSALALPATDDFGCWAGTSERQRRSLRRESRPEAA